MKNILTKIMTKNYDDEDDDDEDDECADLELYEGELGLPGLLVDQVVVVLRRDVERVALLRVELRRV